MIRTWTEAELSGEGVGRKGADAIGEPGRDAHDPHHGSRSDPGSIRRWRCSRSSTMCERFNYYATTRQVKVTRDELLTTLVDITDAAIFGP